MLRTYVNLPLMVPGPAGCIRPPEFQTAEKKEAYLLDFKEVTSLRSSCGHIEFPYLLPETTSCVSSITQPPGKAAAAIQSQR